MLNNQFVLDYQDEIDVDLFAGGGGASTGIERATGKPVDVAINHAPDALNLHAANHPQTQHFCADIYEVDPLIATRGRPVRLLWASPDCKHFSKAKGGKPVEKKIRSLAWVVVKWAKLVHPRIIMLENVEEFKTWGPLKNNLPDPEHKGETFAQWVNSLKKLGYQVEYKELRACDYGAPTSRKRLFVIARCDGIPIVWPEPTHGDPKAKDFHKKKLKPWKTAGDIIDWSIPCPSIFERKKSLSDNTMRRIAKGIMKFVINNPKPFIVSIANWSGDSINPADKPLTTVTANPKGGHHALVTPTLINIGYGEKQGQPARVPGLGKPLGTVTAGGRKHALVAAYLKRDYGQSIGTAADEPLATITQIDHSGLVTAFMMKYYGGVVGSDTDAPLSTVTSIDHNALVSSHIIKLRGDNLGHKIDEPLQTISAQGRHFGEIQALLVKYYGNEQGGVAADEPLDTIPTKDRFALITVYIKGEPYIIVDIGLRMLQPRELYNAQGFYADYIIDKGLDGKKMSKTAQVRMCGNAVCPSVAEALVKVNYFNGMLNEQRKIA